MRIDTDSDLVSYEAAQILLVLSGAAGVISNDNSQRFSEVFLELDIENPKAAYDQAVRLIKTTEPRIVQMARKVWLIGTLVNLNRIFQEKFPDFQVTNPDDLVRDDDTT